MSVAKYIPCSITCVEPFEEVMFRAECRHGAFSVCTDRGAARHLALTFCRSWRVKEMFADYAAGVRFDASELRDLRAHRLIP